ncbi:MAG: hypothetical protein M1817_001323 [Caeruleum heppii]|nr:MAG: hypothetical protein M1817_001323 [Caeruleum heppii]
MGLVDYPSSSSGSSSPEPQPQPLPATTSSPSSSKPTTQKLVSPSNPHKIRVNLPSTSTDDNQPSTITDERPAKRSRLGGGGGMGGFNAMLPAPKRTGQTTGNSGGTKGTAETAPKRTGLASGVSLKTGPAPGFSRDTVSDFSPGEDHDVGVGDIAGPSDVHNEGHSASLGEEKLPSTITDGPPRPTGKATQFKPLSVARKPVKKPKKPAASTTVLEPSTDHHHHPPPPPKPSLFSLTPTDPIPGPSTTTTQSSIYEPLLIVPPSTSPTENPSEEHEEQETPAPSESLTSLATTLNLSPSARRQLLGRPSRTSTNPSSSLSTSTTKNPQDSSPKIHHYSTDAQYAENAALIAAGEGAAVINPVRAIAPGKHSLKQLVGAASAQREALEEHFAEGRRNKKEAGGRYGW